MVLGREAERLAQDAVTARDQVQRVERLVQSIGRAQALPPAAPLQELHATLQGVRQEFPEEYVLHNVPAIALSLVSLPALSQACMCCMP